MDINQILNKIKEMLISPESDALLYGTGKMVEMINPAGGASIGMIHNSLNKFVTAYDSFKLHMLINGLSKDKDMETHLNELYVYVSSSQSRAFSVGSVLKKAIAANSPRICMIYGKILSNHYADGGKDYTADDVIVCNALENACDDDLEDFKEIMELYIKADGAIEYPRQEKERIEKTCSWCLFSRLFTLNGFTYGMLGGQDDPEHETIKRTYVPSSAAYLLLELINEIRQIWDYPLNHY